MMRKIGETWRAALMALLVFGAIPELALAASFRAAGHNMTANPQQLVATLDGGSVTVEVPAGSPDRCPHVPFLLRYNGLPTEASAVFTDQSTGATVSCSARISNRGGTIKFSLGNPTQCRITQKEG